MSVTESIAVLRGHLAQTRAILADLDEYYRGFRSRELPELGRGRTAAIVVAEIFDDTYTALETLFLRVSQFFENRLASDRRHSDLLEKMTLEMRLADARIDFSFSGPKIHNRRANPATEERSPRPESRCPRPVRPSVRRPFRGS